MPQFAYDAVNKQGKLHRGVLDVETQDEVITILRETGLYAVRIKPKKKEILVSLSKSRSVSLGDLAQLSRQFTTLITSGITVPQALAILSRQSSNAALSKALKSISNDVVGGTGLADAFSKYPHIFDNLYIAMLRAGEVGGLLDTTLNRLSQHLEKEKKLRESVKSAVSYPKVVGIFAIIMFVGMMVVLVPTFQKFTSANTNIPAITQFIYTVSDSMRTKWYFWILSILLLVALTYAFVRSSIGQNFWERIKLRLPFVGTLITKTVITRFVRTLSTLIRGGVPIVKALETSGPTSGSLLVANAVEAAAREIEIGRNISKPLASSGVFPPMVTDMIAVGEESGNLPELLDKVSEFLDEEVDAESRNLGTVLQPILLIFVGILVGGMLIALYLPIFSSAVSSSY